MKKNISLFLSLFIVLLLLYGCTLTAPLSTSTPSSIPTTFTPLPTSIPSSTPTTFTPTITPDEKISMGLADYGAAYKAAYPNDQALYSTEVIAERLTLETIVGTDGTSYQFKVDSKTHTPILIMSNPGSGEQSWRPVHPRDIVEIPGGIEKFGSVNSMYPEFYQDVNAASINTFWSVLEPQNNKYDFSLFDKDVLAMRANGLEVRGQALVYMTPDWAYPEWIKNGNFTKTELENIIVDHITTVIQHGKALGITEWVVVNEPFKQGERENDFFYHAFGGYEYIDIAFTAARKADPDAILIYNDYANHSTKRADQNPAANPAVDLTKKIISRLKNITVVGDDGVARPVIDAVGVQSHLGGWIGVPPDMVDVEKTLKSYGLPVIITEFDVTIERMTGTKDEILRQQAKIYADYLKAVVKSGAVTKLTFWGLTDEAAINSGKPDYSTAPALIDQYNKPKLAYYEVLKVLFEQVQRASQ